MSLSELGGGSLMAMEGGALVLGRDTFGRLRGILEAALEGCAPDRADGLYLVSLSPHSLEATLLRAVADFVSRRRFHNTARLFGQIGITTGVCAGRCRFCGFGQSRQRLDARLMSVQEVVAHSLQLSQENNLCALFLMATYGCDWDYLLAMVQAVRKVLPPSVRLCVTIGDFERTQAEELRTAGVSGAYHVLRLREGIDTAIPPARRRGTIRAIREAGLDWYYSCEPIGPEHSDEEIVEQLWLGVEEGCVQHGAMRRIALQGTGLSGQITEHRLAQIVAVATLASLHNEHLQSMSVQEPNTLGLAAGANALYAESGANARRAESDLAEKLGVMHTVCSTMLREAGFATLVRGDGVHLSL